MRRNLGIIGPISNPSSLSASGVSDTFDVYNARLIDQWPKVQGFVSISPSTNVSFNEGSTFTISVITEGFVDGESLFYTFETVSGTVDSDDFTDGLIQGSFAISNDQGSFNKTLVLDAISEPNDAFIAQIRTGSVSGPIVLTSGIITINNPVFNVTSNLSAVNEGQAVTFSISTENMNNNTLFYSISGTGINQDDFVTSITGSFPLTSNFGSVSVTVRNDLLTEGSETFTFFVRLNSTSGPILAQTSVVINDTSRTPTATVTPNTTSVNEGNTVTFTVSTVDYASGPISWIINQVSGSINAFDFTDSALSGNATVSGSSATISRTLQNDLVTEGTESFTLSVRVTRPNGQVITIGTSPVVTINDTSQTPTATVTPNVSSINEGQTVIFTVNTSGYPSGPLSWQINQVSGVIRGSDFTADQLTGIVNISGSTGTISLTAAADTFDEGPESFTLSVILLRSEGNATLGTSSTVTINDTSTGGGPEPTYKFQGSNFGYISGGNPLQVTIEKFSLVTDGNSMNIGNITLGRRFLAGQTSEVSGYSSSGRTPLPAVTTIDKFPFATDSNATFVGNVTQGRYALSGQSSSESGYACGGANFGVAPAVRNEIDKFPFATDANATAIGVLTTTTLGSTGQSSTTSGYATNGQQAGRIIQRFPFATDTNTVVVSNNFAPGSQIARWQTSGQSSDISGYAAGGTPSEDGTRIDKFPFASESVSTSVGQMPFNRAGTVGQSSDQSGYVSGGSNNYLKFPFATDSSATSVGNLVSTKTHSAGQQH